MFYNLLSKIIEFVRDTTDYIVNLYANEWLFRLLTYIAIIITILIPVVSFMRYLVRIANEYPEEPKYKRYVTREFIRLNIEDCRGSIVKHYHEMEIIPKTPGLTYTTWILETDGILKDYNVYPGTIRSRYKELGKIYVVHDFKRVLQRGKSFNYYITFSSHNAYTKTNEYYNIPIYHPTKNLAIEIIFPSGRLPRSSHVVVIRGMPEYTERVKPKIIEIEKGLSKITWAKKRVNPGTFKIVWEW